MARLITAKSCSETSHLSPSLPSRTALSRSGKFDKPENGGNGDGVINSSDAVYFSLWLWIDSNHTGTSEPEELFTLPDLGISSLALDYKSAEKRDRYGNQLHYRAKVNAGTPQADNNAGPFAYDVFLSTVLTNVLSGAIIEPPETIKGAETPEQIPTEVVHGIFLRVASCSDSDPELYKRKCSLVQRAVGLEQGDAERLPVQIAGFRDEILPLDKRIADLAHSTASTANTERAVLIGERRDLIERTVSSLRQKLSPEGNRKF